MEMAFGLNLSVLNAVNPLRAWLLFGALAVSACQMPTPQPQPNAPSFGTYLGSETRLLDGDLVNFKVRMSGSLEKRDLIDYSECVAAQYTLVRGYAFARHVRTTVDQQGSVWAADAIYTISSTIPRGLRTIEAEVIVDACHARGIPTV